MGFGDKIRSHFARIDVRQHFFVADSLNHNLDVESSQFASISAFRSATSAPLCDGVHAGDEAAWRRLGLWFPRFREKVHPASMLRSRGLKPSAVFALHEPVRHAAHIVGRL